MTKKSAMEEEIKQLQKQMGGLVKTIVDLKSKVDKLEKKLEKDSDNDIESIVQKQNLLDKAIAANNDAIKKVEMEIVNFSKDKEFSREASTTNEFVNEQMGKDYKRKTRRCRYYNRGFCKFKTKCRFFHPLGICKEYLTSQKCETLNCLDRHPKPCKWLESKEGCRRGTECEYSHATFVGGNSQESETYQCISCKDVWEDKSCVVEYGIQNIRTYFCLNCEEWVKHKSEVFNEGWTLLDEAGFIRNDI